MINLKFHKFIILILSIVIIAFGAFIYLPNLRFSNQSKKPHKKIEKELGKVTFTAENYKKNSNAYTLIPLEGSEKVILIDSNGEVKKTWDVDAVRARLLKNGNLLVVHGTKSMMSKKKWSKLRSWVYEYDEKEKVVWKYEADDILHHDLRRFSNGNTLLLKRDLVPAKYKEKIIDVQRRVQPLRSDEVLEITPSGEVVWSWRAHESLDINSCGAKPCRDFKGNKEALKQMRDWTHVNTISVIPENKWFDQGYKEFKPGNIIILPRNWWTVFIVDKDSKKIVWEYSGDYKGGISGGHDAQIIPKGYPGAGNMLIFDNGRKKHSEESLVLEINPVKKNLVWVYENGKSFFSSSRGAIQRLRNGNTLISEDIAGKCFEVNQKKEIVWKFESSYGLNRCMRYCFVDGEYVDC